MHALRFALVGDPVAHSRSPVMHRAAFAALGLPHTYDALRVTASELPGVVAALRAGDFAGLNVTLPHKRDVLALVDRVDLGAAAMGAANTLVREPDGAVVAHNTDAPALRAELEVLAGASAPWSSRRGLILGAGGAARAALSALRSLRVQDASVRSRRHDPSLAPPASWQPWGASAESEARTFVVLQATSAGMVGADPGTAAAEAVAWDALPPDAVALDLVYAPASTPFLEAARRRALRSTGGLGMLARQGALALELWLPIAAPLATMCSALMH